MDSDTIKERLARRKRWEEDVRQDAELFYQQQLEKYNPSHPKALPFEEYKKFCRTNAWHRAKRKAEQEVRRQARTVSLDEMLEMREEVRNA